MRNGIEESLSAEAAARRISAEGREVGISYIAHAGFDFPDDDLLADLIRNSSSSFTVKPIVIDERVWHRSPFYPADAYAVISCTLKDSSVVVRKELYHFTSQLKLDYNHVLEAYESVFSGVEVFARTALLNQVKTLIDRVKEFKPSNLGEFLAYSHYYLLLREFGALQNVKVSEVEFGKYSEVMKSIDSDVLYLASPFSIDYIARDFPDSYILVNPSRQTLFTVDDLGDKAIISSKLLRLIK